MSDQYTPLDIRDGTAPRTTLNLRAARLPQRLFICIWLEIRKFSYIMFCRHRARGIDMNSSTRLAPVIIAVVLTACGGGGGGGGSNNSPPTGTPPPGPTSGNSLPGPRPTVEPRPFVTFESGQVRPLALSADGQTLYATNTPDNRVEIFSITNTLKPLMSVPVGLEPVAIAEDPQGRLWVVNHLSDSVSIIDPAASPPRVVQTLWVGDEPRDIVFAGENRERAFITTAHRGQTARSIRRLARPVSVARMCGYSTARPSTTSQVAKCWRS